MATMKKPMAKKVLSKAQNGKKTPKKNTNDSTSYYKQRANIALENLATGDLRNFGTNLKNFANKQSEYKSYTKRNKPGYDAEGKSNFGKLFGFKKGGSVGKSKKPKMKMGGSFEKLAPPYDKATYADKIAGATMKKGGMVKKSSKKK